MIGEHIKMAKKFYAVKNGRKPGVYTTWEQCKAQVDGFSGATYKSFPSKEEAESFVGMTATAATAVNTGSVVTASNQNLDMKDVLENDIKDIAVAYVDGSFDNQKKQFSYGAVIGLEQQEYRFCEMLEDADLVSMRNVAGEIKGAECAMKFAMEHECKELYIYHDYEGIAKWCLGEWKTNKEGTKAYKAFYDNAKHHVNIHFVKVKGHSNDKYNDIADQLAKSALGLV